MSSEIWRDVEYSHGDVTMIGQLRAPDPATAPSTAAGTPVGVLLIHDAFGISEEMIGNARRLVAQGHPVFLADVWGGRQLPTDDRAIGPLIGGMAGNRPEWLARVEAAHETALAQPEFAGRRVALLGYCFGGSSALEYLRTGADVAGVASIHGGLDLLAPDWSTARPAAVLLCTGADDPMATAEMRTELVDALDGAGMEWQLHVYSGTTHAFTSPKAAFFPDPAVIAHHPRSAARAWESTTRFLRELSEPVPSTDDTTRTTHA